MQSCSYQYFSSKLNWLVCRPGELCVHELLDSRQNLGCILPFVGVRFCRVPGNIGKQQSPCPRILPCSSQGQLLRLAGCSPHPQYFDCLRIAARNWWRLQITFRLFPKHSVLLGTMREFTLSPGQVLVCRVIVQVDFGPISTSPVGAFIRTCQWAASSGTTIFNASPRFAKYSR